jgi:hypothetical protein
MKSIFLIVKKVVFHGRNHGFHMLFVSFICGTGVYADSPWLSQCLQGRKLTAVVIQATFTGNADLSPENFHIYFGMENIRRSDQSWFPFRQFGFNDQTGRYVFHDDPMLHRQRVMTILGQASL